ncbi:hypothetical protein BJX96DRAFT_179566 [Aspergillus floccosus]
MHRENFRPKVQLQEQNRHIEKLEATLQEYQARIFNTILTDELGDATIAERHSIIREHISNWVECLPDACEFERNFDQAILDFDQLFGDVTLEHWTVEFLRGPSVAQTEIFSSTLYRCLYTAVFCPYIMGASNEHCSLFTRLERELNSLQIQREITTSRRTNTTKAYTSCPDYTDLVKNVRAAFLAKLRRFFSRIPFDEDFNVDHKFHNLEEQIMDPALKLAQDMNQSSQRYYWDWHSNFNEESLGFIYKRHLKHFIVYDIRTHNQIARPKEDASHIKDDKPIAKYLFTIYPALYRGTNGPSVRIEKATILVTALHD